MILIITPENRDQHSTLLEKMHRIRYEVFVERCGWKNLGNDSRKDVDEFDQPWVTYYLKLSPDGEILAGLRTLPTNHPYMIDQIYHPKFRDKFSIDRLPCSPNVWEMSRYFVVDPDYRTETGHAAKMELYVAVFEHAFACGAKSLCAVGETYIMARAMRLGWEIQPISVPFEHKEVDFDGEMLAINLAVNERMIAKTRSAWNLSHKVVHASEEIAKQNANLEISIPGEANDDIYSLLAKTDPDRASRLMALLGELSSEDKTRRDRAERYLDSWIAMEVSTETNSDDMRLAVENTLN